MKTVLRSFTVDTLCNTVFVIMYKDSSVAAKILCTENITANSDRVNYLKVLRNIGSHNYIHIIHTYTYIYILL